MEMWLSTLLNAVFLLAVISFCGFEIYRRCIKEKNPFVVIPGGIIFGIALYIFFLNLFANFVKSPLVFYLALVFQVFFMFIVRKFITSEPLVALTGKLKAISGISFLIWGTFLLIVTSYGPASSGDATNHYILSSLFIRGDYPMHSPYQPDLLSYYHLGGALILGAFRSITGASFELLFALFSFISLFSITQILSWQITPNIKYKFIPVLFFLVPVIALISLGQFMFAWPAFFSLPNISEGFINWFSQLPIYGAFGASTSLGNLLLFFHRFLSIAFWIAILPIILQPRKDKTIYVLLVVIILLASIALTDESIFVTITPAILIITLITVLKRSIIKFLLFSLLTLILVVLQGGVIKDALFDKSITKPKVLFFPKDEVGTMAHYHKYQSYRTIVVTDANFHSEQENFLPFKFFHLNIILQISFLTILFLVLFYKKKEYFLSKLTFIFLFSSIASFIAYFALVPEGMYHMNGNRFIGFAYHFSGIGIAYIIYYWWMNASARKNLGKIAIYIFKALILWVLIFSVIPPLSQTIKELSPKSKTNWFFYKTPQDTPLFNWIRNNVPLEKRIVMLTEAFPGSGSNTELVVRVGTFTPVWTNEFYAQGFDTNAAFADLFYTINPEFIKELRLDYIVVNNIYLNQLTKERVADLQNTKFFQPVYSEENGYKVLKVLPAYLSEGRNFKGTFQELKKIAPKVGSYWVQDPPQMLDGFHRSLRLLLADREIYYDYGVATYNFIFDVKIKYYGKHTGKYNYLILNKNTNPKDVCSCEAKLLWEGLGNDIKLWQTL